MINKLRVGVIFSERSGEHEVSLLLAPPILKATDREDSLLRSCHFHSSRL